MPRRASAAMPRVGRVDRGDQHALDPLLLQQVEVGGLAVAVLAAVAQEQREPGGVGGVLDAAATSVKNGLAASSTT